MVETKQDKKYDHAEAIRQQIKHTNQIISQIDTEDKQSFQQYFNKSFMAVSSLEAMITPFGYESKLVGQNPQRMKVSQQLDLLRSSMVNIYEFLFEHDLFYADYTATELGVKDKEGDTD